MPKTNPRKCTKRVILVRFEVDDEDTLVRRAFDACDKLGAIDCHVENLQDAVYMVVGNPRFFDGLVEAGLKILPPATMPAPRPREAALVRAIAAEFAPEDLDNKAYREYRVDVGSDYAHGGTVTVTARSEREAEALALNEIGSTSMSIDSRVEGTEWSASAEPVPA